MTIKKPMKKASLSKKPKVMSEKAQKELKKVKDYQPIATVAV